MTRPSGIDWGLLLLRLGFATLLVGLHGWARLLRAYHFAVHGQAWTFVNLVDRLGFPFPSVFAVLSALSESVAVVFVALGLFTRPAAALVAVNMGVAFYNEAGKGDPYQLPALYLLDAVVLIVAGPGRISLDARRRSGWGRLRK